MPREYHTANLLPNGKVLIAGGFAILTGWPVWASAELYDSATATFLKTGSMTTSRNSHTATLLPNGKVLIAGGDFSAGGSSGISALASAELYDPATGTFAATGAMAAARRSHTATDDRFLSSAGPQLAEKTDHRQRWSVPLGSRNTTAISDADH